ncbi:MAG TPA: NAD(P)/FAD-dependent oxidoreductase [Thiobacillaceae bacterium]|nr:NAD(P)/FAD-dependent oxidoreductase [Thiobacillaceae bacterium]HNU64832.1 NAD(P)/FAD-dependent oxidoreductase [Thiobacillaceae bacterium]
MRVAILGAGPAGMSCANACLSFGLTPVVIEREDHLGGAQRSNFHPNLWLLGSPSESGQELTRRLVAHYVELQATTLLSTQVVGLEQDADGFLLRLHGARGHSDLAAGALVIASGMRPYATPELAVLARNSERVILGPLNDRIRDQVHDAHVLILGGGDNALDHALFLAERGNRIRVCTRGAFSGREALLAACRARAQIELMPHCRPTALQAGVAGVTARWIGTGARHYDWLLVMYGYRPNSEVVDSFAPELRPERLASGHLRVDAWQRTSVPGIYAAGDVTDNVQPAIPTAIAQGLAVAKAIERDWKAARQDGLPGRTLER